MCKWFPDFFLAVEVNKWNYEFHELKLENYDEQYLKFNDSVRLKLDSKIFLLVKAQKFSANEAQSTYYWFLVELGLRTISKAKMWLIFYT